MDALLLIAPAIWAATALVATTTLCWIIYRTAKAVSEGHSFIDFLIRLPRVNFLAVVGAGLAVIVTMTLLAGAVINAGTIFRVQFDYKLIDKIIYLVLAISGLDVIGFIGKRVTFKHGAPDSDRPPTPRKRRKRRPPPVASAGSTP